MLYRHPTFLEQSLGVPVTTFSNPKKINYKHTEQLINKTNALFRPGINMHLGYLITSTQL